MNYLFGLIAGLSLLNTLFAQETSSVKWKNYLTNNNINCIVEEDNFLWLGTTGGLVKFNTIDLSYTSYTKENSGLPHHNITSMTIDSVGNKWIGTWGGGLIKYDGISWQVYNQKNSPLANDFINSVSIDSSGNLWVALNYAPVFKYDGQNWINYHDSSGVPSYDVKSIAVDKTGIIWFASGAGITKHEGYIWYTFNPNNSGLPSYEIENIFIDDSNYVWVGTQAEGIAKYDRQDWYVYTDGAFVSEVYCISRDSVGDVWVGTRNYGIIKFDYFNWTTYFNSPLQSKWVNSIIIDSNSKKWIGTDKGFFSFHNQNWMNYEFINKNLFSNDIINICSDNNNNIYIGTNYWAPYIFRIDGNLISNFSSQLVEPRQISYSDDGRLWIGNYGSGVGVYNHINWTFYNNGNSALTNNYILTIYPDGDSLVWIGTWGGLFKFDGMSWYNYNSTNSPLVSDNVSAIVRDKSGALWVGLIPKTLGGQDGGVFKFNGTNWIWYHYYNSDLPSNRVIKIIVDSRNNKWFGTQPFPAGFQDLGGGIAKLNDNQEWIVYDTSNSKLETNWITDISLDLDESLWISTKPMWSYIINQSYYYGGGVYHLTDDNLSFFSTANSLLPDKNVTSIEIDRFGNKWFGTVNGLSVFNEQGINTSITDPQNTFKDKNYYLSQNYPNPFNPTTQINYSLQKKNFVTLKIYNLIGELVGTLVNEEKPAGSYSVKFNVSGLPSGIYFYRISAGNFNETKKMILLK